MATKAEPFEDVTIVDVPLTDEERRMLEDAERDFITVGEVNAANVKALRAGTDLTARQVAFLKAMHDTGSADLKTVVADGETNVNLEKVSKVGLDDPVGKRAYNKALKQASHDLEFDLKTIDELPYSDELQAIRDTVVATQNSIASLQGTAGIRAVPHFPLSDAGNGEYFGYMFGDRVRFDHARRRWLVWNRHHWRLDADAEVHRMALEAIRERQRDASSPTLSDDQRKALWKWAFATERFKNRLDALLDVARTLKPIADDGEGWDETPGLLGVPNGVIDLRTGELRDGLPSDRITKCTAVEFDPAAQCPQWLEFLGEVLEDDPGIVPYLQRLVGYSLTAEGTVHMLIFLMGTGRNGKGTFLRALDHTLGEYASTVSGQAFSDGRRNSHTTEVTDLESARFAYCEELGSEVLNAERLKDACGGGHMIARRMRENTRTFRQTWQLWFTTNGTPRSDDNSLGWWSRVRAIDFPHSFVGEREDTKLDEKLQSEAAGILAWAVRGAVSFYENGIGEMPRCVSEKTDEYRSDLDPIEALFQDGYLARCDDEIWTPTQTLLRVCQEHSRAHNLVTVWLESDLGAKLKSGGFRPKRHLIKTPEGAQKLRGYHGVRAGSLVTSTLELTSWRFLSDNSYVVEPPLTTSGDRTISDG
jgi:P4 family phage/plasmid primase-like protien